jgi:hypothetical protein
MTNSIELRQTNPQNKANPHRIRVNCISPFPGSYNPNNQGYYLKEGSAVASIHELLFNMRKDDHNYWVGAVVPEGATAFTKVQVFFHPKPTNGGALDKDYPKLTSQGWRAKYDHMWFLGVQLANVRKTPLIYPFMRESAFSRQKNAPSPTFMFATRPRETLSAIVSAVRTAVTGKAGAVDVGQIGVSGFSSGVDGMKLFAATFGSSIVETTDFDGPLRKGEPRTVWTTPGAVGRVITQVPPKVPNTPGYLYLPAWQFKFIGKTAFAENVHKQIGYLTFLTAMAQSRIV